MADLKLFASKSDYETKIGELSQKISALDSTITQYEQMRGKMESFIEDGDDSYKSIQEQLTLNIKRAHDARRKCEDARDALQKTVKQMEDFGGKVSGLASQAKDTAEAATQAAIDLMR